MVEPQTNEKRWPVSGILVGRLIRALGGGVYRTTKVLVTARESYSMLSLAGSPIAIVITY